MLLPVFASDSETILERIKRQATQASKTIGWRHTVETIAVEINSTLNN